MSAHVDDPEEILTPEQMIDAHEAITGEASIRACGVHGAPRYPACPACYEAAWLDAQQRKAARQDS